MMKVLVKQPMHLAENLIAKLMMLSVILLQAGAAVATDSAALSKERREFFTKTSFFCETGREPTLDSLDALAVRPTGTCRFSGPLNTVLPKLKLEPPFLNPRLTIDRLREILRGDGIAIISDDGISLRFRLNSGAEFIASSIGYKSVADTLIHFAAYPIEWGPSFLSISYSRVNDLETFRTYARTHSEFSWQNPHASVETRVTPRLTGPRPYLPLELLAKCDALLGPEQTRPSLLLVGDMHTVPDVAYFRRLIEAREFSWIALEITRDRDADLAAFMAAKTTADEDGPLERLTNRQTKDIKDNFKAIVRVAKSRGTPVILLDYNEAYFNFPFTNTSFHGRVIATRNALWAERLPAQWSGPAVLFAGLDHFAAIPNADFQNFALERFPGLEMKLVNPLEKPGTAACP